LSGRSATRGSVARGKRLVRGFVEFVPLLRRLLHCVRPRETNGIGRITCGPSKTVHDAPELLCYRKLKPHAGGFYGSGILLAVLKQGSLAKQRLDALTSEAAGKLAKNEL
jgi:hypothetical protein